MAENLVNLVGMKPKIDRDEDEPAVQGREVGCQIKMAVREQGGDTIPRAGSGGCQVLGTARREIGQSRVGQTLSATDHRGPVLVRAGRIPQQIDEFHPAAAPSPASGGCR